MKYQQIKKMLLKRGIILVISVILLSTGGSIVCFATENTKASTKEVIIQKTEAKESAETGVNNQAKYSKDENVYGKLSANGKVENLYVVNQFDVTKAGTIMDYGTYNHVENLTDLTKINTEGGSNTVAVKEGNFYYQGQIEKGALPWNLEIDYKLNDQDKEAKDLAGQSGNLEIHMKTSKNKRVNSTFYNNYLMQISMTLSNQTCSNIVAENGTISDAGENKQITFTVMPEKEGDLILTADVTKFEMKGISIAAVPFSMSMELPDTSEMSDGLTDLSDGISSLNGGTQKLNTGAGEIKNGMVSLLDGMEKFHPGLTTYANGVVSLNKGIQKIDSNVGKLSSGASNLATGSKSISVGLNQLSSNGTSIVNGAKGIQKGINDTNSILTTSGINTSDVSNDDTIKALYQAVKSGYITDAQYYAIVAAIGTVGGLNTNYGKFETGLEQYIGGVSTLAESYGKFNSGVSKFSSGLSEFELGFDKLATGSDKLAKGSEKLTDGSKQLVNGADKFTSGLGKFRNGVQKLADGTNKMADNTSDMPKEMQNKMDEMMSEYEYDFEPLSFVSEKNTNIDKVQFVLTTEEIKMQEPKAVKEEEHKDTFIQRVEHLFSGLFDNK
jgi:X-X-X-Leu-X-X-Gly heptad repeats